MFETQAYASIPRDRVGDRVRIILQQIGRGVRRSCTRKAHPPRLLESGLRTSSLLLVRGTWWVSAAQHSCQLSTTHPVVIKLGWNAATGCYGALRVAERISGCPRSPSLVKSDRPVLGMSRCRTLCPSSRCSPWVLRPICQSSAFCMFAQTTRSALRASLASFRAQTKFSTPEDSEEG